MTLGLFVYDIFIYVFIFTIYVFIILDSSSISNQLFRSVVN